MEGAGRGGEFEGCGAWVKIAGLIELGPSVLQRGMPGEWRKQGFSGHRPLEIVYSCGSRRSLSAALVAHENEGCASTFAIFKWTYYFVPRILQCLN